MLPFVACLAVSASLLVPCVPTETARAESTHVREAANHPGVTFLSQAEYELAVQRGEARSVAKFKPTNRSEGLGQAKPVTWYQILFSATDWSGIYIPTREGTSTFGYNKINAEHNLYNPVAINAPYHGYADTVTGTRRAYIGYALINGEPIVQIKSIADTSHTTSAGQTPDGKIVGTITSYCVGYVLCPAWING